MINGSCKFLQRIPLDSTDLNIFFALSNTANTCSIGYVRDEILTTKCWWSSRLHSVRTLERELSWLHQTSINQRWGRRKNLCIGTKFLPSTTTSSSWDTRRRSRCGLIISFMLSYTANTCSVGSREYGFSSRRILLLSYLAHFHVLGHEPSCFHHILLTELENGARRSIVNQRWRRRRTLCIGTAFSSSSSSPPPESTDGGTVDPLEGSHGKWQYNTRQYNRWGWITWNRSIKWITWSCNQQRRRMHRSWSTEIKPSTSLSSVISQRW